MKYKLKDVCNFYSGTGFPTKYQGEIEGDYPFYKVGDIANNVIAGNIYLAMCNNYVSIDTVKKIKGCVLPPNTVVFAKIGEALKLNRRAITSCACLIDNNAMGIAPKEDTLRIQYFYFFMKNLKMQVLAESTTVPSVRKTILEDYEVEIPSLNIQEEIESRLTIIQDIIEKRKKELSLLDNLIKARFVEMFGDQEYEKKRLIELIQEGAGLSYGIVVPGDNVKDGIPMIRPSDFKNGSLSLDNVYRVASEIECKYKKTRLFGDEILVQVIGQPGQVMLSNERCKGMNVTRNLAVIRIDKDKANRLFISHYLSTEEAQFFMFGSTNQSTLKQLPLNKLKELPIPIVPVSKQNQFADFVNQVDKSKFMKSF